VALFNMNAAIDELSGNRGSFGAARNHMQAFALSGRVNGIGKGSDLLLCPLQRRSPSVG
jgi:hypothetical protein